MQRVFVVLSLVVAAFVCGASRASAVTELCPAYASPLNALDAVGDAKTATLFSYELDALSASTVSGTLAVQTDKGWFAAPFGPVAMTPHPETFNFTGLIFTRKSVFSAPLYLRFGMPVTVVRAFVTTASTDDTAFSWPAHGPVACDDAGAPMQFAPTHPDPVRFDGRRRRVLRGTARPRRHRARLRGAARGRRLRSDHRPGARAGQAHRLRRWRGGARAKP